MRMCPVDAVDCSDVALPGYPLLEVGLTLAAIAVVVVIIALIARRRR